MTETEKQFMRRFAYLLGALLILTVLAAMALSLAEHVSWGFGLLWTLDTVATVGIVHEPSNTSGRLIIAILELLGIGTLFYGFATVAEFFVSGHLSGVLELRRMRRMVTGYDKHYIVCGYGRMGRQVALHLRHRKHDVVVIEESEAGCQLADADGLTWLQGNASDDETLTQAGILRAAAILSCVDSDAENTFVTLSARGLRSDITIVSRSSAEDAESKLERAGADRVISPYKTTGAEMARIAIHPQVSLLSESRGMRVEQIEVAGSCRGAGRTVGDVRGRAVIVAIEHADGSFEPQPPAERALESGDRVIALGDDTALEDLENMFEPTGPRPEESAAATTVAAARAETR